MQKSLCITILIVLWSVSSFSQQSDFPVLQGPYLGQKMPGTTPEVFAPGIVSIPGSTEFTGCFSPDNKDYYFYRFSANDEDKIYFSRVIDGKWTNPRPAAFSQGFSASQPHITLDNKSLYFGWHHPLPKGEAGNPQFPSQWVTTRTSSGWSEPKYAGQGMFVSSDREGRFYVTDLSYQHGGYLTEVTVKDGRFTSYKVLKGGMDALRHMEDMAHPFIAPDGSYLLFDVKGGNYMYVCFKMTDGTWGEAIDLTKHGFDPMAGGACVSPDGKYLFFHLNGDIWWVDAKVIEDLRPKK